jgi:hypothetical protein
LQISASSVQSSSAAAQSSQVGGVEPGHEASSAVSLSSSDAMHAPRVCKQSSRVSPLSFSQSSRHSPQRFSLWQTKLRPVRSTTQSANPRMHSLIDNRSSPWEMHSCIVTLQSLHSSRAEVLSSSSALSPSGFEPDALHPNAESARTSAIPAV